MDIDLSAYPLIVLLLLTLTIVILILHVGAWVWARRIRDSLVGQDGYALSKIVTFLIGGVALGRLVGFASTFALLGTPYDTEIILGIGFVSQLVLIGTIALALIRIRRLQ